MLPTTDLNYFIDLSPLVIKDDELTQTLDPRSICNPTQEDALLRSLIEENEEREDKLKWGEIAERLEQKGSKRSGKQCRERYGWIDEDGITS